MDAATITVLAGFLVLIASAVIGRRSHTGILAQMRIFLIASTAVWLVITILGEYIIGWADNSVCYTLLGCNDGFWGYDGTEHFLLGFVIVSAILWASRAFPSYSLLSDSVRKTLLTIVLYATLVAVCWEILEFLDDSFRTLILHQTLFSIKFHINILEQSSNADTMGDISLTMIGSLLGAGVARFMNRDALTKI